MKLKLRFIEDNKATQTVRRSLESVLKKISEEIPEAITYDNFEIDIRHENKVDVKDNSIHISLDKDDKFLRKADVKGIEYLLLYSILYPFTRKKLGDIDKIEDFIMDILVNREMVKNDLGYHVSYKMFSDLTKDKINNISDFIQVNKSWLSFYQYDEYYYAFFRQFAKRVMRTSPKSAQYKGMLKFMKCNLLDKENIEKLSEKYKEMSK